MLSSAGIGFLLPAPRPHMPFEDLANDYAHFDEERAPPSGSLPGRFCLRALKGRCRM